MRRRALLGVAGAVAGAVGLAAVLAWGEAMHWRASWRGLRPGDAAGGAPREAAGNAGGREAVLVLGYQNRGIRANYVNRYRVHAGLRSLGPARASTLLFAGGCVAGDVPEAVLMQRYARDRLGYSAPIRLETRSTTTWQNIQRASPLIEDADAIKIVSNPLHAEKAREYLWLQRPDLAQRLVRARDYRFGELIAVKPVMAMIGLVKLRRLRIAAGATPHGVPTDELGTPR